MLLYRFLIVCQRIICEDLIKQRIQRKLGYWDQYFRSYKIVISKSKLLRES